VRQILHDRYEMGDERAMRSLGASGFCAERGASAPDADCCCGVVAMAVGLRAIGLSNLYPEAKSVWQWLRHGWHVAVAYVIGFFVMLAVVGWHADPPH
jgi:hypothetical protein